MMWSEALLNLPIDAVQEFQVATNRFRRRSRPLGLVGFQRRHTQWWAIRAHGSASIFARDGGWQALPATADPSADTPPFDPAARSHPFHSGPLWRDRLFAFVPAK